MGVRFPGSSFWRSDDEPDQVARVFPAHVLAGWLRDPIRAERMAAALRVLPALPLRPGEDFSAERLMELAHREATNAYLSAAEEIGLFGGREGRQLRRSLRSGRDDDFRGAIDECMAAWWLSKALGFRLTPRPPGRGARVLDLGILRRQGLVGVEVKAPFRPGRFEPGRIYTMPADTHHLGAVLMCLHAAAKQLPPGLPGLVILTPSLDWPIRQALLRAFHEDSDELCSISAAMVLLKMTDFCPPAHGRPALAVVHHRCYLVLNPHATAVLPTAIGRGWPVYAGDWWKYDLQPVKGSERKFPVCTPAVPFQGKGVRLVVR